MNLVALISILVALWFYVRPGTKQIDALRRTDDPAVRKAFFIAKLQRQAAMFLVLPLAALEVSGNFARALHPFGPANALGRYVTHVTGVGWSDLNALPGVYLWSSCAILVIEMFALIVAIEAIPILRRSRRVIVLGNFAVLRGRNLTELGLCSILAINAGVGEELLFRGFIPAALLQLGLAATAAFLIPVAIFGICHIYQGVIGIVATSIIGLVLTALYLLSGSLLVVIAVHVVIDVIGLVLRPAIGMLLEWIWRKRGQ